MNDRNFDEALEGIEMTVWEAFKLVVDNFLADTMLPTADSWLRKCLRPTESWCAICH
jgi:hypothetical protein